MKLKVALLSVLMMAMVFVSFGKAEAFEAEGSVGVDVLSSYVWRGQNLVNDSSVIQPALDVAGKNGFAAGYWANYDTNNGENTETDLTLSYSRDYGKLSTTVGYIHYAFNVPTGDTEEIFLALGYDTFLSPSLTIYHDLDEGDGQFLVFAIGHTMSVGSFYGKAVDLNLGASVGYNMDNAVMGTNAKGKEFTDFYNGEITASLTIPVTKNITIEPKIAYSDELSDDADVAISAINASYGTNSDSDVLYGGVNISMSF